MKNKTHQTEQEVRAEDAAAYSVAGDTSPEELTTAAEDRVIANAIELLRKRLATPGEALTNPTAVRNLLALKLAGEQSEKFSILLLDNKHRVLGYELLFHGTIDGASVYPREVVKMALQYNAAAVILAHNHPSGVSEPSQADIQLTKRLKEALELISVRVLDHFIVGGSADMQITSLAERGLV